MANLFTDRPSLQFELKLLTKFLLHIQPDCQTSAHATHDFAKADYNAGLESRSAGTSYPILDNSATTRNRYTSKNRGNLKDLLQKGGYRDFSRKILPLPRLAANPTLTAL